MKRRLHTQRDFHVTTEAETGDAATNRGIKAATRSWKRKEQNLPPEPPEGVQPRKHLDFGSVKHLASKTVRINLCCTKPPILL